MNKRSYSPGSEWLYVKIYAGSETIEALLTDVIGPFVQDLVARGVASKWHFVRYSDPDWHLRLRLLASSLDEWGACATAVHRLLDPYLQQQRVHRVALDTYEREVERYGDEGVDIAESIFHHDSDCVLRLCQLLEAAESDRWLVACVGIDWLLRDFGRELDERLRIMKRLSESFAREFEIGKAGDILLGKKYREHGRRLANSLAPSNTDDISADVTGALRTRSAALVPLASRLTTLVAASNSVPPLESLLESYVHMFTNRLFKTSGRKFETVVYDLLYRAYESATAKLRSRTPR